MSDPFTYLSGRVPRAELADTVRSMRASAWLAITGGGSIGWASDEVVAILPPGVDPDAGHPGLDVRQPLAATVRPGAPYSPVPREGVVALRWFELRDRDWAEFLDLSAGAWPAFEAAYDATIMGLFRAEAVTPPAARALLVTRYASFAEWERSRQVGSGATPGTAEAATRFRRRHEITGSTVVRVAPLG